ncbi:MAG TPA: hypothetical protein VFW75_00505, partial [Acetobacteraceae bacterium]|nr:hypothetical protein [Acetobacteraceae bacterium]
MPATTGNGLAMRGGLTLEALAMGFDVHLLVVPLAGPAREVSQLARRCATSVAIEALGSDPLGPALAAADPARTAARLIAWPTPLLCRFADRDLRRRIAAHAATVAPD